MAEKIYAIYLLAIALAFTNLIAVFLLDMSSIKEIKDKYIAISAMILVGLLLFEVLAYPFAKIVVAFSK